ncbi:hypothetical protein [Candidatus Nitrospira neomarina]|uniref:Uncharacterized protein n=1 Tax=Candidatus Nitrospira neomarina TaxID=3020899 RepID=A0AA96GI58_9BACT|nr:hypothetical protein [Candidatus Nitrospira neomarina]WNM60605.1 hypothetical protein PQG83_12640 [Candidatus Nitrospira neomarina]
MISVKAALKKKNGLTALLMRALQKTRKENFPLEPKNEEERKNAEHVHVLVLSNHCLSMYFENSTFYTFSPTTCLDGENVLRRAFPALGLVSLERFSIIKGSTISPQLKHCQAMDHNCPESLR